MDIRVLGCYGGADKNYRLTSFLVNGRFVVDAGALTNTLTFDEQKEISDIYVSHIHMDHISGLPFLFDNIFGLRDEPVLVHAHAELIQHLRRHIFNDICWPDFSVLPSREKPTMRYVEVPIGKPLHIAGLEVTPVWVNHLVPNAGIIVTEAGKSWVYPSDTSDTDDIWRRVNDLPDPRLLFLECSFPNRFEKLAEDSRHLTPSGVAAQLAKLERIVPTRIYHCKPSVIKEIEAELKELGHPDMQMLKQDHTYRI